MSTPPSRNLSNWLHAYMEFTRDTESPDAYHFWTAVTVIGSATKRQCYLDMGHFKIFPNFYTIVVGPSGARKSVAVALGMNLASRSGIRKFSDKITGAALIKDLSENQEKVISKSSTEVQLCSPILIYSSELGVFMGPDAYSSGIIADLTDLYDCPPQWSKRTISREEENVIAPYVSFLAASTPQTLRDCIPVGAVGQGFTSRIIFVWASGRRKKVPIPVWDVGHEMLEKNLIHDLNSISQLRGKFEFDKAGLRVYRENYNSRPEPEDEYEDERLRGYASRKDIHTLKVAMAISLASKDELVITELDMKAAIDAIKWLDIGLTNVFAGSGTSVAVEDVNRIYRQISLATQARGYLLHRELMKRNYFYLNAEGLASVIQTLVEAGVVEEGIGIDQTTKRSEKFYKTVGQEFIGNGSSKFPKKLME